MIDDRSLVYEIQWGRFEGFRNYIYEVYFRLLLIWQGQWRALQWKLVCYGVGKVVISSFLLK